MRTSSFSSTFHSDLDRQASPFGAYLFATFVFCALGLLYLGTSFHPIIWDETEGQYAGAAREISQQGDWLIPTNDGIPRLQKPPLVTWSLLTSYKLLGVNIFAARLPNALATLGWFFAVFLIGKNVGGLLTGIRATYLLGTTLGVFIFCHIIMPEPFLAMFLTLTIWAFFQALSYPHHASWWMTLAWVFMALGCLSKGLHGAVYPLLLATSGALFFPQTRLAWSSLLKPIGPLLFLAILTPWYAYVETLYPGFLRDHFFNEQIGPIFNHRWPPESNRAPLIPFLLQHLVLLLPWILFLPSALFASDLPDSKRLHDKNRKILLLWIWVAITWSTILFSARQDYYTLTSWGPLAVLLAFGLTSSHQLSYRQRMGPFLLLAFIGLLLTLGSFYLHHTLEPTDLWAAPAYQRENIWKTLHGFSQGKWLLLMQPMFVTGLALLISSSLALLLASYQAMERARLAIATGMLVALVMVAQSFTLLQNYFSLEPIAQTINREAQPNALVVCQGPPHLSSSLFFYLNQPVHWIDAQPEIEFASREHQINSHLFLSPKALVQAWFSPRQIFLITEESHLPSWKTALLLSPAQRKPIAQSGTRVLLVNQN